MDSSGRRGRYSMYKLDLTKEGGLWLDTLRYGKAGHGTRRIAFYYQNKVNTKEAPYITSVGREIVVMIKNTHVRIW